MGFKKTWKNFLKFFFKQYLIIIYSTQLIILPFYQIFCCHSVCRFDVKSISNKVSKNETNTQQTECWLRVLIVIDEEIVHVISLNGKKIPVSIPRNLYLLLFSSKSYFSQVSGLKFKTVDEQ